MPRNRPGVRSVGLNAVEGLGIDGREVVLVLAAGKL